MRKPDTIECPKCEGAGELPNPKTIGKTLLRLRKKGKVKRESLRRAMDVSGPYLSDVEHGRRTITIERVAQYKQCVAELSAGRAKK